MAEFSFSQTVQIKLRMGLHIRPCMVLAQTANRFPCQSRLVHRDRRADCKSPLELMGLGATHRSMLLLETEGEQAEEALRVLEQLFATNFGIVEEDEVGQGGH